jgi:cellulose synthase/poly-beta-1,6-N-acetylglucosamine synthase-like glycosyltransferase
MSEMAQLLAQTDVLLLAFSVLIFDMPRYTLSLLSLALFGARRRGNRLSSIRASVSVIIPTFNGGTGLDRSIASLQRQSLRPVEIIVVDDGSTDKTRFFAERARAQGLVDTVICHGTRCGRSAAINAVDARSACRDTDRASPLWPARGATGAEVNSLRSHVLHRICVPLSRRVGLAVRPRSRMIG